MKGLRALIISLFFFLLSPHPAMSALPGVHLQVIQDVLALSPSDLRTYLTDSRRGLERGAIFLDYLPTIFSSRHHDPAHVIERIDELTEGLSAKIREQKITQYNIALLFGILSHYVVDAYLPGRMDLVHPLPPATFQGFEPVPIPSEVVGKGIGWRQEQRREGKKDEEILSEAYSRAVEGVANLWFTLWEEAGGSLSDVAPPGTQLRAPLKKPRRDRKKGKPPEGPPEAMKREV